VVRSVWLVGVGVGTLLKGCRGFCRLPTGKMVRRRSVGGAWLGIATRWCKHWRCCVSRRGAGSSALPTGEVPHGVVSREVAGMRERRPWRFAASR